MSTIKFENQDKLDELIARLYLDTRIKLNKKELLEIIFNIGIEDYDLLRQVVHHQLYDQRFDLQARKNFIDTFKGSIILQEDESDEPDPKSIWTTDIEDKA